MFSCVQKQEMELVREIRMVEFQRSLVSSIFEKFIDNENVNIRRLTADAIAKIGNPIHLPILKKLLNDKEASVIKKTIFAIGQLGDQDSLLISLLNDHRFNLYNNQIISALGMTKSDYTLTTLQNGLDSYPDSLKSLLFNH